MIPDMVSSIVQKEVTTLRNEVTILREEVTMLQEEVPILWEEVTDLRMEVRSKLQSFYEKILTLIERSSAHPATAPTLVLAPVPTTTISFRRYPSRERGRYRYYLTI